MLQNATPLRKWAPWPPNISDEHVSCAVPATGKTSLQILFKCPTPAIVFETATKPSGFAPFWQGAPSLSPAPQNDLWTSKSAPAFCTFDFEMCFAPQRCALFRHRNFKKSPNMRCFVHFAFDMCFSPQRRALFRHRNFQNCSVHVVLCTFWLRNARRATMACNFSSRIWPDGSAPAALASLFDPLEPQIIGKTQWFATFVPFRAPASSFFSLFLFSDLVSSSLLLSDSSHLCFSICPYCRKFDF